MTKVEIGSFEFDLGPVREELDRLQVEKILLQLPDGLKTKIEKFAEMFDQDVVVWGNSCYGACDLPEDIGCADVLLQIGHSEIPYLEPSYPIIYLEGRCRMWKDLPPELLKKLEGKVALYAPVQHIHQLERAAENIEAAGLTPVIGEGDERIKYPGQILGCNYSVKREDVDHHLYIGTGRFHPLGLSFSLGKDVFIYNPVAQNIGSITEEERDDFLRKRYGAIAQVEKAEKVMVIISTKIGQIRRSSVEELLELGEKAGKTMMLMRFGEIRPEFIDQFRWDCAVNTACPRIALDDYENFKTTMLTPREFKIGLDINEGGDWKMDEIC